MQCSNCSEKRKTALAAAFRLYVLILSSSALVTEKKYATTVVEIDTTTVMAESGPDYLGVSMDFWPNNKCDNGLCPWTNSSVLTAPLENPRLRSAFRALGDGVALRVGGTLQDVITYAMGEDADKVACPPMQPEAPAMSRGFKGGCLTEGRWTAIRRFCAEANCKLIFGINALRGRQWDEDWFEHGLKFPGSECSGHWDSSNAKALIQATAHEELSGVAPARVWAYAFGNELDPKCVSPDEAAAGVHELASIVKDAYSAFKPSNQSNVNVEAASVGQPLVVGTDHVNFDKKFFDDFVPRARGDLHAVTYHGYHLGAGKRPAREIMAKAMQPSWQGPIAKQAAVARRHIEGLVQDSKPEAIPELWFSETGGAYSSGNKASSGSFGHGFWYLPSLAGHAAAGLKKHIRQAFIGGFYELVDKVTFEPNPDYYAAVLYRRLVDGRVLGRVGGDDQIRVWAFCCREGPARPRGSVVALILNFKNTTSPVNLKKLQLPSTSGTENENDHVRLEYMLTAAHGNLFDRSVRLNGEILRMHGDDVPPMDPKEVHGDDAAKPMILPRESYAFVVLPNANAKACTAAGEGAKHGP